ncbi:MAG: hypothetical protein ACYSWO_21705 [Planctomycetota bacterium]|jgi:hypothetical protein
MRRIRFDVLSALVVLCLVQILCAQTGQTSCEHAYEIVRTIVVPTFPVRDLMITDFVAVPGGEVFCTEAVRKAPVPSALLKTQRLQFCGVSGRKGFLSP